MFLRVTDSVMNSDIYSIGVLWQFQHSAEGSLSFNRCLKGFKGSF